MTPIPVVALDYPSAHDALALVDRLHDRCGFYKIGLELFVAEGPSVVRAVRDRGKDVFLDLKLYDIPNTVAGAVRSAARLDVRLLTVHTAGGRAMLSAAQDAAVDSGCKLLGVTALTSVPATVDDVLVLAAHAADARLHGVVCSGREAAAVRARFGELATLVPGIRPADGDVQDQTRVVTPAAAAEADATYVVLGRAVTAAADPVSAYGSIEAELRGASPRRA